MTVTVTLSCAVTPGIAWAKSGDVVGATTSVVRLVKAYQGADVRDLVVNEDVFGEDEVTTGDNSATRIIFQDDTVFSMGPNSRVKLKNVATSSNGSDRFVLEATRGVFEFVSGTLHSEAYRIETPTATIGVRGTIIPFVVAADGTTQVGCLAGAARVCGETCVDILRKQWTVVDPDGRPREPTTIPADFYELIRITRIQLMMAGASPLGVQGEATTLRAQAAAAMAGLRAKNASRPNGGRRSSIASPIGRAPPAGFQRSFRAERTATEQARRQGEQANAEPVNVPVPPTLWLFFGGLLLLLAFARMLRR